MNGKEGTEEQDEKSYVSLFSSVCIYNNVSVSQSWQTLSVKGQIANSLGFVGYKVSVSVTQLFL